MDRTSNARMMTSSSKSKQKRAPDIGSNLYSNLELRVFLVVLAHLLAAILAYDLLSEIY